MLPFLTLHNGENGKTPGCVNLHQTLDVCNLGNDNDEAHHKSLVRKRGVGDLTACWHFWWIQINMKIRNSKA